MVTPTHTRSRALALTVAAALALTDCRRVRALFENQQRSYVDAPTTLDAVRARRAAGDRVFLKSGDGPWEEYGAPPSPPPPPGARRGGATDGADLARAALVFTELCLIGCVALPVAAALFVASAVVRRQEAAIHRDGRPVYYGVFDFRGRFLFARVRDGDTLRDLGRLQLPELAQEPIVEVARMPILRDGGLGAQTRTSIDAQTQLVRQYRAALDRRRDADERAALLVEALRWLGEEALPLAAARIEDASAAAVLRAVCRDRAGPVPAGTPSLAFAHGPLLATVVARPTPATARVALGCAAPPAAIPALRDALRAELCAGPDAAAAFEAALATLDAPARRLAWTSEVRCTGHRGVLFDALSGRGPPAEALWRAIESEGSHALRVAVITRLDPSNPTHREVLFRAAATLPSALVELAASQVVPSAAEAVAVVRAFAALTFPSLREGIRAERTAELDAIASRNGGGYRGHGEDVARIAAVELLSRASGDAAARAAATAAIDAVVREGGLDDRSYRVTPLRLALGAEATLQQLVMIAEDAHCPWRDGAPEVRAADGRCLYAYTFWTRGCTEADFARVHASVAQRSAPPQCTGAPPSPRPAAARAQWTPVAWP